MQFLNQIIELKIDKLPGTGYYLNKWKKHGNSVTNLISSLL